MDKPDDRESLSQPDPILRARDHTALLRRGTLAVNRWVAANPNHTIKAPRSDFSRLNLSGVSLGGADLARTSFEGSDLSGANLQGASLHGTILQHCEPQGANL